MRIKNKIKKRLVKINAFLKSKKKPRLKNIHLLRLEVKHLEAFVELMRIQKNAGARSGIPDRLNNLFHEAGRLRNSELQIGAIYSITKNNRLSRPTLFLEHLKSYEKKTSKRLRKKRKSYAAFKIRDFVKHPGDELSSDSWKRFLAGRASSILDLLAHDIISDIRSLHHLRKILKSILYVSTVCKKSAEPVRVFLKTHKAFMKSVESKIGSLHDTGFFVNSLEENHDIIQSPDQDSLKKIKLEWQNKIMSLKEDLQPLLTATRQFAIDLKDQTTDNMNIVRGLFNN
jgi:CHAD domain